MSSVSVEFTGGAGVRATVSGFAVETDQPSGRGGEGSAPSPFDLFLASLATCAGAYVLNFLRQRGLSADDVRLTLTTTTKPEGKMLSRVSLRVELPEGVPAKYSRAIVRAVDLCTVKRHLFDPPEFETSVVTAGAMEVPPAG